MDKEESIYKIFKKLSGQTIKKLSVKENSDQCFHLVTNKIDLKFGANDLGVWIEKIKILKSKGRKKQVGM